VDCHHEAKVPAYSHRVSALFQVQINLSPFNALDISVSFPFQPLFLGHELLFLLFAGFHGTYCRIFIPEFPRHWKRRG